MKIRVRKVSNKKKLKLKFSLEKKKGILFLKNIPFEYYYKEIKYLFEIFGDLGRIFFINDIKNLNNFKLKKKNHILGWIEYLNKKNAKQAMAYFKKFTSNPYLSADISVRYLRSFNWDELSGFFS
nr:pre-rRNA-processing protein ESF2 [Cryptomonas curvata]